MIYRSSFHKNKVYFHLTVRVSSNRLSARQLKTIWSELPLRFQRLCFVSIHSCVLMSNHLHALCSVDETYFDFLPASLFDEFKKMALMPVENFTDESVHIQKIESFARYREVYRYIYRNPLEAGLVPMAELYEFSTLFEILGFGKKRIFANDNMGLITNPYPLLSWINWDQPRNSTNLS